MELNIYEAQIDLASAILQLQKRAYQSEAAIYNDDSIPPLTQTLESIKNDFENHIFLTAFFDSELVGSVKVSQKGETCHLDRLIVETDFQRQGIGTKLLRRAFEVFPDAVRFELFTGSRSQRNIEFYQKLGFKIFARRQLSEKVELVFMEKFRN